MFGAQDLGVKLLGAKCLGWPSNPLGAAFLGGLSASVAGLPYEPFDGTEPEVEGN